MSSEIISAIDRYALYLLLTRVSVVVVCMICLIVFVRLLMWAESNDREASLILGVFGSFLALLITGAAVASAISATSTLEIHAVQEFLSMLSNM